MSPAAAWRSATNRPAGAARQASPAPIPSPTAAEAGPAGAPVSALGRAGLTRVRLPAAKAGLPGPRPPFAWPAVLVIAAAAFAVEMAVSARYGYHRDELYFLQAGRHPAAGYVDQPPLTPLAAWAVSSLTGGSLAGLRALPALVLAALTVTGAVISRALGGGRASQVLAAVATATCGEYLAGMHLLTTTTLDFLFWALTLLLAVKLLSSGNPRWWLAIGGCVGIGASAKWTVAVLAAALLTGVAATPVARGLLRSRWLAAGCVLALVLGAPDVVWQAMHGWPNLDVFSALSRDSGHNRLVYWPAQILYTGFALTPLWITGLAWCLREAAGRRLRPIGIAAAITLVLFFALGGKPYYAGGVYTFLFAAGSVPAARWLAGDRGTRQGETPGRPAAPQQGRGARLRRAGAAAALAASAAVTVPVALPVYPARVLRQLPLQKINYDLGETIGWPQLVAAVARQYRALPPAQRAATTILAGNYGEAGALAWYGPAAGLPGVYSGANNFWYWGPPPAGDRAAIAVNVDPALLRQLFTSVREVAVFRNGPGVADNEQGARIYRVSGLRYSWAAAWPMLRDFS
ncbi:MAG: ArnT family glycosyltransferase [Gemmatimonadota bacterium]